MYRTRSGGGAYHCRFVFSPRSRTGASPSPSPTPVPLQSRSGQPTITWSTQTLNVFMLPGDIRLRTVSFTASALLSQASIEAVPDVTRFVSINPNTFATVPQGQPQSVNILFSVPAGIGNDTQGRQNGPASYDGTLL